MPRFFEDIAPQIGDEIILNAENANHCAKALRMTIGEHICVCSGDMDYDCAITEICADTVKCRVIESQKSQTEPSVFITLYQCLPKGDKLETVVQKSVELGVYEIKPVLSSRCISRPDDKKSLKKTERLCKIAKSACEQSGRGRIVNVSPTVSFDTAVAEAAQADLAIMFYEGGGEPLGKVFADFSCDTNGTSASIAVLIGPEGGFSETEVQLAKSSGIITATLGKRILRTETAPLAALTAIMLLTGNLE
ncbi:MAG: 16S rRNA (uracil(1498)-N(3))-methyltransferase [Acutalibacteraceae bacterium]